MSGIARVQNTGASSTVATFAATPTVGDLVMVAAAAQYVGSPVSPSSAVADNYGNTYILAKSITRTASVTHYVAEIWYSVITNTGSAFAVTYTPISGTAAGIGIAEYSLTGPAGSVLEVDGTASASGSGTSLSPGAIAMTGLNDLVVAVGTAGEITQTWSLGSGFSLIYDGSGSAGVASIGAEDQVAVTSSSITPTLAVSTSSNWACVGAAFYYVPPAVGSAAITEHGDTFAGVSPGTWVSISGVIAEHADTFAGASPGTPTTAAGAIAENLDNVIGISYLSAYGSAAISESSDGFSGIAAGNGLNLVLASITGNDDLAVGSVYPYAVFPTTGILSLAEQSDLVLGYAMPESPGGMTITNQSDGISGVASAQDLEFAAIFGVYNCQCCPEKCLVYVCISGCPSGAGVVGATVTISTNPVQTCVTNSTTYANSCSSPGTGCGFSIPGPGTYTVNVTATGYAPATVEIDMQCGGVYPIRLSTTAITGVAFYVTGCCQTPLANPSTYGTDLHATVTLNGIEYSTTLITTPSTPSGYSGYVNIPITVTGVYNWSVSRDRYVTQTGTFTVTQLCKSVSPITVQLQPDTGYICPPTNYYTYFQVPTSGPEDPLPDTLYLTDSEYGSCDLVWTPTVLTLPWGFSVPAYSYWGTISTTYPGSCAGVITGNPGCPGGPLELLYYWFVNNCGNGGTLHCPSVGSEGGTVNQYGVIQGGCPCFCGDITIACYTPPTHTAGQIFFSCNNPALPEVGVGPPNYESYSWHPLVPFFFQGIIPNCSPGKVGSFLKGYTCGCTTGAGNLLYPNGGMITVTE